ncbi:hypothetical protein NFI96_020086 [Prochilodus magdalenae]|nr:hypothetical protein NFI96_020086 [Prochilodus magdalenae]
MLLNLSLTMTGFHRSMLLPFLCRVCTQEGTVRTFRQIKTRHLNSQFTLQPTLHGEKLGGFTGCSASCYSSRDYVHICLDILDFHMGQVVGLTSCVICPVVEKLKVSYSRSSGPGGQHVNKVSTKAEVRFHVQTADWISEEVKNEIILKNQTRINKAGELIVTSEVSRSQQRNLENCLQKISDIIIEASQRPPEPSEDDIALRAKRLEKRNLARLQQKKIQSATKRGRQVDFD